MKTKAQKDSGLQNRTAQGSENTAKPEFTKLDWKRRNQNQALPTESVLSLIQREAPNYWNLVEVVGKWVWVQFEDKQPREITFILAQLGFFYNSRRQVWQHPCGQIRERADFDPRKKYKAYFVALSQTA